MRLQLTVKPGLPAAPTKSKLISQPGLEYVNVTWASVTEVGLSLAGWNLSHRRTPFA
jgi:hypothetical protein